MKEGYSQKMKDAKNKTIFLLLTVFVFLLIPKLVFAALVTNKIMEIPNSYIDDNGILQTCTIKVTVSGDDYYTEVKTLDGYTLINDKDIGSICFATLNDAGELVSTRVPYIGGNTEKEKTIENKVSKGIRENGNIVKKKRDKSKSAIGDISSKANKKHVAKSDKGLSISSAAGITPKYTGNFKGITVILNFPDVKSNYSKTDIENFCNGTGYTANANNGSVREYFSSISGGQLNYTNTVVEYTALNNRAYYTNNPVKDRVTILTELFNEVTNYLTTKSGIDFTTISKDESGSVRALNILYAGACTNAWADGLWPSCVIWNTSQNINGQKFITFQITDLPPGALYIGTFCHENAHMILDLPDTYSYDDPYQASLGYYDLMSATGYANNPSPPNPYFRTDRLGWGNAAEITSSGTVSVNSNQIDVKKIKLAGNTEFFLIENVQTIGRWASYGIRGAPRIIYLAYRYYEKE